MNDVTEQRVRAEDIRKTIEVGAPIDRVFRVFTSRMGEWWSKDFSINRATAQKDVVIEPRAGGRWYEIGEDGSECQWGRVLEWEEPDRVLLVWQINAEWSYDPAFETAVEVRFEERGDLTIVTFEHRDLDRYGDAASQQRERMDGGWGMLLGSFKAAAERA
jgi:uncharacterized protein YndB with AHSA1/START domain